MKVSVFNLVLILTSTKIIMKKLLLVSALILAGMFISNAQELGVIAEIGLDYHFNKVPISISADWRPFFQIVENTDFGAEGFGVNVRYVFGKK